MSLNIGSGKNYPANSLSNFSPHPFEIDGVQCNSFEGFLQSLKYSSALMQIEICKLVGRAAKFKGKKKKWYQTQKLYWQGVEMDRKSEAYQLLLDRAFDALAKNTKFQKALLASGKSVLSHTIGKNKEAETVLTTREFISRLYKIRERLQTAKLNDLGKILKK